MHSSSYSRCYLQQQQPPSAMEIIASSLTPEHKKTKAQQLYTLQSLLDCSSSSLNLQWYSIAPSLMSMYDITTAQQLYYLQTLPPNCSSSSSSSSGLTLHWYSIASSLMSMYDLALLLMGAMLILEGDWTALLLLLLLPADPAQCKTVDT
jgi:hypothetical protein